MGYTYDGRLIILVVEGRRPGVAEGASLMQEAEILRHLGCKEALNLDGGGSSCMLVNGKPTINPSDKEGERPIPAVFLIRTRQ
jgi:exopolysaccharide biosynthesis protein